MRGREKRWAAKRDAREARATLEARRSALWAPVQLANDQLVAAKRAWDEVRYADPDTWPGGRDEYWRQMFARPQALGPAHDAARRALEEYKIAKAQLLTDDPL